MIAVHNTPLVRTEWKRLCDGPLDVMCSLGNRVGSVVLLAVTDGSAPTGTTPTLTLWERTDPAMFSGLDTGQTLWARAFEKPTLVEVLTSDG